MLANVREKPHRERKGSPMLKKLLACCLSLMLVLGCVTPAAVAEDPSTPTDLCQHLNTYTVQCSENPGNYEPYNSKQHADCIYYYNEIYCSDCKALIDTVFVRQEPVDLSTLADHVFVDGKCSVCDYEACKHANTETHEVKVDGSYSSDYGYDVSGHLIDVFVYEEVVCKDCGETVSSTLVRTDRETRAHTYVGGYCSVCGRKECLHPISMSKIKDKLSTHLSGHKPDRKAIYDDFDALEAYG